MDQQKQLGKHKAKVVCSCIAFGVQPMLTKNAAAHGYQKRIETVWTALTL